MTSLEKAIEAAKILDSKKAEQIEVIEIRDISQLGDYFVIATGTSNTHVASLSDELEFKMGEIGVKPDHIEGHGSNTWILQDFSDVIVHIFTKESRSFYDLDRLWQDGQKIAVPFED